MKVENSVEFRSNIRNKIKNVLNVSDNKAGNLEKSIFNYCIQESKKKKIVKKWENEYFVQLYVDKFRSIWNNLNPKYNKTDFVVGKWHQWPKWRGVTQWPDWWGNDWLAGLGVVWGNWGYGTRYSPFQGRGRIGAENACNRSSDCIGFFESNKDQYHFIF